MDIRNEAIMHSWFARRRNEYIRWYPKALNAFAPTASWSGHGVDGAYIHVPFCDKICHFCPFNKRLTDPDAVSRFVTALCGEIEMVQAHLHGGPLKFIYFGGGTPSVLSSPQLTAILGALEGAWGIAGGAEVSLEVHPSHATVTKLSDLRAVGVNRVSIGIQSFRDRALGCLGATHAAEQSRCAVQAAHAVMPNFAIDLLYAYGEQSLEDWFYDLEQSRDVPHVSCYALVPIDCKSSLVSQEREIDFAVSALEFGDRTGLRHYASCASGGFDMCAPGFECRYELDHWAAPQKAFVGLGPGAFGFAGGFSTVNKLSDRQYANDVKHRNSPLSSLVPVSTDEMRSRYFVLGIKTLHVPLAPYRLAFGTDPLIDFADSIGELTLAGFAEVTGDTLRLTELGRLFVDSCSAVFFSDMEKTVPHPEEPELRRLEAVLQK